MLILSYFYDAKLIGDGHSGIWPGFWGIAAFVLAGFIYGVVQILKAPSLGVTRQRNSQRVTTKN